MPQSQLKKINQDTFLMGRKAIKLIQSLQSIQFSASTFIWTFIKEQSLEVCRLLQPIAAWAQKCSTVLTKSDEIYAYNGEKSFM